MGLVMAVDEPLKLFLLTTKADQPTIWLVMEKKSRPSFTATEVGTLLEELRADFRLFGEKLEGVEEKLTGRIEGVEEKLTDRIEGVEEKLTDRIDGIAANQAKTLEEITAIRIRLTRIETNFEKRLAALETAK
jgi:hypothetical protein